MTHDYLISWFKDAGVILGALASAGASLAAMWKLLDSMLKRQTQKLEETIDRKIFRIQRQNMLLSLAQAGPENSRSIDAELEDNTQLFVPVMPNKFVELPGVPNCRIMLLSCHGGYTRYMLETTGAVMFPRHRHRGQEQVTVVSGTMEDVATPATMDDPDAGLYVTGMSWVIPPNTWHQPLFHSAVVVIEVTPPLKNCVDEPPRIDGLERVKGLLP